MLLNDYPQLIFTTQEGNCFMPTQAEKECRRITSIMNNHEKQQALTEKLYSYKTRTQPHQEGWSEHKKKGSKRGAWKEKKREQGEKTIKTKKGCRFGTILMKNQRR